MPISLHIYPRRNLPKIILSAIAILLLAMNVEEQERIQLWLKYHVLEPRFDNPDSAMPAMGLSEDQAAILSDFLATVPGPVEEDALESEENADEFASPIDRVRGLLPQPFGLRDALAVMLIGFMMGVAVAILGYAVFRVLKSRQPS